MVGRKLIATGFTGLILGLAAIGFVATSVDLTQCISGGQNVTACVDDVYSTEKRIDSLFQ